MPSIRVRHGSSRAEFTFLDRDALRRGKLRPYDVHDDEACPNCGEELLRRGRLTKKRTAILCPCGREYEINSDHDPPPPPNY